MDKIIKLTAQFIGAEYKIKTEDIEMSEEDFKEKSYRINISDDDIEDAKQWIKDNNIYMVYPCKNLDELFNRYRMQSYDNIKRANCKALDLYGCTNDELYKMLKTSSSFLSVTPEKEENGGKHKPRQRKVKERSGKKVHKGKKQASTEEMPQYHSMGAYKYV